MGYTLEQLQDIAHRIRIKILVSCNVIKYGDVGPSLSEIISVLLFETMRFSFSQPKSPANDRLILCSQGSEFIIAGAMAELGLIAPKYLPSFTTYLTKINLNHLQTIIDLETSGKKFSSEINPPLGSAWVAKYIDKIDSKIFCIVELTSLNIEPAFEMKLDNLIIIALLYDDHRYHDLQLIKREVGARSDLYEIEDGHDIESIKRTFGQIITMKPNGKPKVVFTMLTKFKYFSRNRIQKYPVLEYQPRIFAYIISLLGDKRQSPTTRVLDKSPIDHMNTIDDFKNIRLVSGPEYTRRSRLSTNLAYGFALGKLGLNNKRVLELDFPSPVNDYTSDEYISDFFRRQFPKRFIKPKLESDEESFQFALGATRFNRSIVFTRLPAIRFHPDQRSDFKEYIKETSNINCVGLYHEICPTLITDFQLFCSLPEVTILYPSDAVSTERAIELAAQTNKFTYIRVTDPMVPILYKNSEVFEIGKSKLVHHNGSMDEALVIAAGLAVHEALKAATTLERQHSTHIRILDLFSVQPIDCQELLKHAKYVGMKVVIAEDQDEVGGIAEAITEAFTNIKSPSFPYLHICSSYTSNLGDQRWGLPNIHDHRLSTFHDRIVGAVDDLLNKFG